MAGPVCLGDLGIVFRTLVDILDHHRNRGAGGLALEHTGQDFDLIGFLALGREARLARTAAIQKGLNVGLGEGHARRHPHRRRRRWRARGFRPRW